MLSVKIPSKEIQYYIRQFSSFEILAQALESQINGRDIIWITDENIKTKSSFWSHVSSENVLVLPPGESNKTWDQIQKILSFAFERALGRDAVFISVGGGVVGDMTGFAASIYLRGVSFIQVPTTLLSQVDASVGGKTGIDCDYGKNLIGSFHQPEAVFVCPEFFDSLPEEEMQNGVCEMIKHAIIVSPSHFKALETYGETFEKTKTWDLKSLLPLIFDSIEIKKQIVEADEKEQGIRAYLNLGHTYGHAIEWISQFEVPHGQAVAMGCILAAQESIRRGLCEESLLLQLEDIFSYFGLEYTAPYSLEKIKEAMIHDKKKKNGKINLILPIQIGKVGIYEMD